MQVDIDEHFFLGRDDTPTKYTSSDETLHIKCQLRYVDLEGLSDGRSIKTILPQIAPRKLVWLFYEPIYYIYTNTIHC